MHTGRESLRKHGHITYFFFRGYTTSTEQWAHKNYEEMVSHTSEEKIILYNVKTTKHKHLLLVESIDPPVYGSILVVNKSIVRNKVLHKNILYRIVKYKQDQQLARCQLRLWVCITWKFCLYSKLRWTRFSSVSQSRYWQTRQLELE